MEKRLIVAPGQGMASLSQQGFNARRRIGYHNNLRKGGILYLGQKQGEIGGEFIARQAWSGKMSQFNIWNWPLEDFYIENAAECRSDLVGNMVSWRKEDWTLGPSVISFSNLISIALHPFSCEEAALEEHSQVCLSVCGQC